MPKVTYNSSTGLVQEAGTGIQFNELPFSPVQAITTTLSSVTTAGVYTVSASSGVLTTYLPNPSAIPAGMVVVRSTSPSAHVLTGSSGVVGVNIFAGAVGGPVAEGQKLTFPATTGASVALISDGRAYLIAATSGSFTIGA